MHAANLRGKLSEFFKMVWNSKEDAGEDERAFYVGEQTDSRSSRRKCLVVFLAIALVAVLIAIIVPVTLSLKSTDTEDTKPVVTPAPVTAACAASQYPETCSETLANSTHTNAQVFTKTTATAASEGLVETRLAVRNSETPENAPAVEVCLDTLSTAAEEMNAVIAALNSTDSDALKDAFDDIKTRLSAAMEFHTTCIDALEEIEGGLGDSVRVISAKTNELFSIALAFVNAFSKFGNNLLLWATSPIDEFSDQHRRRLLASENEDIVSDIPEWLGAEQRRHLLQAKPAVVPCNITVAQDKSGNFTTIMDALKKTPEDVTGLFLICIKKGTYKEQVIINKPLTNIMFRGDGVRTTIITGSLSVALTKNMTTYMSATVIVQGEGFIAQGITFQNTAGPKGHQAVAVRVTADRAAFYQCNFDGFQDTLYAHNYRQYYRDCTIMGTIDYIFGNSIAVFQNCRLLAKKSTQVGQTNLYTAQGKTDRSQPTGFSFQECIFDGTSELVRNQKTFKTFLGRPWKPYSTAVLLRSTIQGHVDPAGWSPWNNSDYGLKTSYFAEFESKGPGAGPKQISARVPWSKQIKTLKDANRFQAGKFIQGNRWVPATRYPNIPYTGDALK